MVVVLRASLEAKKDIHKCINVLNNLLLLTLDRDMNRKHAAKRSPCKVACMSLNLIPSKYNTDCVYANIRAFSANILNICNVVTNVHLPCFMI